MEDALIQKKKPNWGHVRLSKRGLRPLSAICAPSSTIVHFCGPFGPLSERNWSSRRHLPKGRSWILSARPRTTLGCSPPLDAREPPTRGIPQPINSWAEKSLNQGIPQLRLTIPLGSAQGALNRGVPRLRNLSAEGFLGSGVFGHPRVVSIQAWFLAGPTLLEFHLNFRNFTRSSLESR